MTDIAIMVLTAIGTLFILLAALGIVRMPDFYLRLSVTTKAITLGLGLILIGAAVYFGSIAVTSRVVAIIFFLLLTAPVAAHMIGRASYFTGIRMWDRSVLDELKGMYNKETHELKSNDEETEDKDSSTDTDKQ
jgi:multicomponent Na+:H+ antiporter subunit G